jgi:hypothetical protein
MSLWEAAILWIALADLITIWRERMLRARSLAELERNITTVPNWNIRGKK